MCVVQTRGLAMNSFAFLAQAAARFPNQAALIHGSESLTYREFKERALSVGGNLLARGLSQGDRVAFCLANSPRILETIYGCFAAGPVIVPVYCRYYTPPY